MGVGKYFCHIDKKPTQVYKRWQNMLKRVYCNINESYKDVTVCEEWHNFQNFAKWSEDNYNPKTMEGWHLDKDILVDGSKIYSPETCAFVPQEINGLFPKRDASRGVYPIGVCKKRNKFTAQLNKKEKNINLGTFNTPEEAFQAYKLAKEDYIKEVADMWKNLINRRVHQAMYDYQVKITD